MRSDLLFTPPPVYVCDELKFSSDQGICLTFKILKKMRKSLIALGILLMSLPILSADACDAPEGFICGSKKGIVYTIQWIGPLPYVSGQNCCVPSIASNACNLASVGCSVTNVEPE